MFSASDIKVYAPPVVICPVAHQFFRVAGIHIAKIICTGARKARHGAGLEGIPLVSPVLCACKRRLAVFSGLVLVNFRKRERKLLKRYGSGDSVLVVDGERLSPVALTGEYGITDTEIHLPVADSVLLDIFDSSRDGILYIHAVEEAGIHHLAFLGIKTRLAHVATLDQRDDRQVELASEGVVAAVVRRHSHDWRRCRSPRGHIRRSR